MKYISTLVIFTLLVFSCTEKSINIDGHWHLEVQGQKQFFYTTLDIIEDEGHMNKGYSGNILPNCKIDVLNKQLHYFGGIDTLFKINLNKDTLILKGVDQGTEIKGIRVQNCDRIQDYFPSIPLKIELATSSLENLNPIGDASLSILVAMSHIEDQILYSINDQIVSTLDSTVYFKNLHLEKIPKNRQNKLVIDLFVDSGILLENVQKAANRLRELSNLEVYIIVKKKGNTFAMRRIPSKHIDYANSKSMNELNI